VIYLSSEERKAKNLAEILTSLSGLHLKEYGLGHNYSSISIRGSKANQVLVCLNGIPLNNSKTGEVNLAEFPLENLERIEVYKGSSPSNFPLSPLGGVINLVTKKPASEGKHQVSVGYGSYQTSKVFFSSSKVIGPFNYFIFLQGDKSKGNFSFKDDNGTPVVNKEDDFITTRKNNESKSYQLTGQAGYSLKKYKFNFLNDFFYKGQGLPGMNNNNVLEANLKSKKNLTNFQFKKKNLNLNLFYLVRRDLYEDPEGEIGLNAEEDKSFFDSWGINLHNIFLIPAWRQSCSFYLGFRDETFYQKNQLTGELGSYKSPTQRRRQLNMALEDELFFFKDRFILVPQLRGDFYYDIFTEEFGSYFSADQKEASKTNKYLSGKIGSKFYIIDQKFYLKGNLSHNYRQPNFTELFGDQGYVMGNPNLKAEKSLNADVGLNFLFKKKDFFINEIKIEYAYFYKRISNLISFISNSQWTMTSENIGESKIYGHEIKADFSVLKYYGISFNYTYQKALDQSDLSYYQGKNLPFLPRHQAFLKNKLFLNYFSLSYEINYTGVIFRDRLNSDFYYLSKKIIHDLTGHFQPASFLDFTIKIKNITNDQARDDLGYPLPGRSYYATTTYSF